MAVLSLIYRRRVPGRTRIQACANLFGMVYMWTFTVMVTHVSFFYIVPNCYSGNDLMICLHRLCIWYIFIAVVGNYCTCIFAETGTKQKLGTKTTFVEADEGNEAAKAKDTAHSTANSVISRKDKKQNNSGAVKTKGRRINICNTCKTEKFARMHHCNLCEKCVIKRDHHCFFMGVCIGKYNHLYFIYFTLFMGIGTFYGLLLLAKYMNLLYGIQFYGPQTLLSLFIHTMLFLVDGKIPLQFLGLFCMFYISLSGTIVAFGLFFWHVFIVSRGQTSFEARCGIRKYSKGNWLDNLREVFTNNWILPFLLPFSDIIRNKIRS